MDREEIDQPALALLPRAGPLLLEIDDADLHGDVPLLHGEATEHQPIRAQTGAARAHLAPELERARERQRGAGGNAVSFEEDGPVLLLDDRRTAGLQVLAGVEGEPVL